MSQGDPARLTAEIAEAERQERLRLAEALHDDALQRLFAARQDLAELAGPAGDPRLGAVEAQLEALGTSLRGLVTAMHDESVVAASLEDAVRRLGDDAARRGRLQVRTRVDPRATGGHDTFVVEVVRELLANVVKHADARAARVDIDVPGASMELVVRDDGRGVPAGRLDEAAADGHVGHARLRRRLAAIGGGLEVRPGARGGTEVHVRLPLDALRAQRELEDELRRERGWSAALVAAFQDGFLVFREGRVVQVNGSFCALTGWTPEEVLDGDDGARGFWPAEEREALLAHVLRGRRRGEQEEIELRRRDGSALTALVAGRGVRDEAGEHAGMLVTVKDISALHEATARRAHELELEITVAATTRLRHLVEVALSVRSPQGLESLLDTIGATICDQLGWGVVINLHRPAWDDFVVHSIHGLPEEARRALQGRTYGWGDWSFLQERFLRREAYFIPAEVGAGLWDAREEAWWQSDDVVPADAPEDRWRSADALLIPVRHTDGQWLGLLSLDSPRSGRRPTDEEIDVLTSAALVMGIALQRATEAVEGASHRAALEQLLRVSSRIAGARSLEPVLDKVVRSIGEVLGFERVLVDTVDPDDGLLRTRAGSGIPVDAWPQEALAPEQLGPLFDIGFRVEGCYLLDRHDVADRLPAGRELPPGRRDGRGPHAWDGHRLVVPLYGPEHELVGVVWVDEPADHLRPSSQRLQALRAFANQASAALISAWAYERLQRAAGDAATQLGNSRAFEREVARERTLAVRADSSAEVVLCEVSGLDLLDGEAADHVLAELSATFGEELRATDRAFRVGPGAYALLLPGASARDAELAVDRLRLRLAALHPVLSIRTGRAKVDAGTSSPGEVIDAARRSLAAAGPGL